jgi:hypothetical protein
MRKRNLNSNASASANAKRRSIPVRCRQSSYIRNTDHKLSLGTRRSTASADTKACSRRRSTHSDSCTRNSGCTPRSTCTCCCCSTGSRSAFVARARPLGTRLRPPAECRRFRPLLRLRASRWHSLWLGCEPSRLARRRR